MYERKGREEERKEETTRDSAAVFLRCLTPLRFYGMHGMMQPARFTNSLSRFMLGEKPRMWNLILKDRLWEWDHFIDFCVVEKYQGWKISESIYHYVTRTHAFQRLLSSYFYLWAISAISSRARIGLSNKKYEKHNWVFCSSKQRVAISDFCSLSIYINVNIYQCQYLLLVRNCYFLNP